MPVQKGLLGRSRNAKTAAKISIRGSGTRKAKPPMAKASKVPPGKYRSKILSIKEVTTTAGNVAVEVVYDLTAKDGSRLQMREVIPVDSWAFEKFCDALIAAGLEEDDDLLDAVGIVEDVELVYPEPRGLGHFGSRNPVKEQSAVDAVEAPKVSPHKVSSVEDDDDDFLDVLDDED